MRAVWWREVRELLLPGLGAVVALAALGVHWAIYVRPADRVAVFGVVGAGLGLFQGLLDRRRRDDGFFLQRPASALVLHGTRGLAALSWLLLGAGAFAAGLGYERARWAARSFAPASGFARYSDIMVLREGDDAGTVTIPVGLPASVLALLVAVTWAGWAATRFGVARPRRLLAVPVTGVATLGTWSFVARAPDAVAAAAIAGASGLAWAVWGLWDLAGDRR